MKILILIPVYKRPEVLEICLENLKRFIKAVKWRIEVVLLLSPEDHYLAENEKLVRKYGHTAIYFKNLPVSDKINAGIEWVMKHKKFEYLMNFGSDDLIHPQIEQLYKPYFDSKYRFFGINTLFFYELATRKTIFFNTYNFNGAIGAARMIHYSILKRFTDDQFPLYEPGLDCGLDTSSAMQIKRNLNEFEIIIDSGEFPYIVDIKTPTNINQLMHIEQRTKSVKYFPDNHLKQFYEII